MNKLGNVSSNIDLDDPRFRIKPYQQIIASSTGAFITSVFGKFLPADTFIYLIYFII